MNGDTEDSPELVDVPIGLTQRGFRVESDSFGRVEVPAQRYWGAQTQRTLEHFRIGDARMPLAVFHAYGHIKAAAAVVNRDSGLLPAWKAAIIRRVGAEVADGELDSEFVLGLWQSGSGTQTNMNVNEVMANRCIQLVGGRLGSKAPFHPNDDINRSQSSNDTFVAAMHIAGHSQLVAGTLPAVRSLAQRLGERADLWSDRVKIGRTHLMDAVPMTVGQEWSGFTAALTDAADHLEVAARQLLPLAIGGTAVGTGLTAPPGFGAEVAAAVARSSGHPHTVASNPFAAQGTLDSIARVHAALRSIAVTLFKIGNDIRLLGSGPRTGLAELRLPEGEPGSSIMPGKVNPTQVEALLQVCLQVMGADEIIQLAASQGNLQLNTFRPVVVGNFLRSCLTLQDVCRSFEKNVVAGVELNEDSLERHVAGSTMLVTALAPELGYDRCARIARNALEQNLTLRRAAIDDGVDPDLFDRLVDPRSMT